MKKNKLLVTFLLLSMILFSSNTNATIIVSGDVSIVSPLDPNFRFFNFGNQEFFIDVLNGSSQVAIVDQSGNNPFAAGINTFYSTQSGITASRISIVTDASIDNAGMLVVALPDNAFSNDELAVMNSYIDNGGSIFFLGDAFKYTLNNAIINQALLGIGSTLSIAPYSGLDIGVKIASGAQIANSSYTEDVKSFTYGYVSGVNGGTPLFSTKNGTSFISYEQLQSVPEPSTALLFLMSIPGLLIIIRKKR